MRRSVEEPPNVEASTSSEGPSRRRRRRRIEGAPNGEALVAPAVLLAVAVVGSVLAIGTVHVPVLAVVSAITLSAAALALHKQAESPSGIVLPLPAILFFALAIYTLLQVVPMPMRWLEALAPGNADVWQRSLLPFGDGAPTSAPISLDPGASLVEVLKWTTYAAAFFTAAAIGHRHGAVWGVLMVFGAALVAALATLGHGVVGATKVYGLYQPKFNALAWHIGPLLNANNLAGYLNLGALCGLGLLLSRRPPIPRWAIGLGVALIVAIDVTSASRGGVLALPVGMIALALLARRRRHQEETVGQSASTWLIVAAAAGGALLAALGGSDKAWGELLDKNLSKLTMLSWAKPLVRDHPIFGIGRGAFESVFPAYRVTPGNVVFTHAENFAAQWIAEWGLPVAIAAIVALGWAFGPRRLGAHKSSLAAGGWAGVATLLLQNLVDLGLEIPAVSLGAVAVLGSLWGDERAHGPRERLRVEGPIAPSRARLPAIGLAVAGVVAIVAAVRWGSGDVASDRAAMRAMLEASPSTRPEAVAPIRAALRRAMHAHPAEPYFPLIGGVIAFRARDESPIPWIQRTLERGRVNGRAHYLLAEVLAARGSRRQALLELRLALESDPLLMGPVARLATRFSQSFEDLQAVAPEGAAGAPVMAELGRLLSAPPKPGDPILRSLCDREAILRDSKLVAPRVREAEVRLDALAKDSTTGACADRAHCRAEVLEHADAIAVAHPDASVALELRARVLVAEQKPEEAVKLLDKGCDRVSDRPSCLRARVAAASVVKAPELVNAAAKDLLGAACVTPAICADTATWLAGVRSGRKERGAALALLSRAAREDPNEARWLRVAEAASASGAHVQAADAFEKVAKHRGGADPELKRRIEAERRSALGGLLRR